MDNKVVEVILAVPQAIHSWNQLLMVIPLFWG